MSTATRTNLEKVYIIYQIDTTSESKSIMAIVETEELAHAKIDEIQKKYKDFPITLIYNDEWMEKRFRRRLLDGLRPPENEPSLEELPWYTERWYEDDIINGLESLKISFENLTREQMTILRNELKDIFDNKEDRNVLLQDTLDFLCDKYEWLSKNKNDEEA